MSPYLYEFSKIAVAHLLAVMSPGPDFAMVLRQSLAHGRRTAVWTSIGIGSAISLHITYSLLGVGFLLKNSVLGFALLKYAGALYLGWIGVQALRSRPHGTLDGSPETIARAQTVTNVGAAWRTGFLTNALNPKATLFFVALFPLVISAQTPKLIQAGYGLWMALSTMAWFTFVSVILTRENIRRAFLRHTHWIDRALGVVFIGFAVSLALASLH